MSLPAKARQWTATQGVRIIFVMPENTPQTMPMHDAVVVLFDEAVAAAPVQKASTQVRRVNLITRVQARQIALALTSTQTHAIPRRRVRAHFC